MTTSPPRQIVVDDSDAAIIYSSAFFVDNSGSQDSRGNFGATLKSTLHGTNGTGSFQFQFSGTQLAVYGTNNQGNTSGHTDPMWECFVDDVSIGSMNPFQFVENNWSLCTVDGLVDKPHVLTVNANSRGRTFWFDYIRYTPSVNVSLENALVLVDHRDHALQYDSNWMPLGSIANLTSTKGSSVSLSFLGVSLQWYGDIPTERPHAPSLATYSIDGGVENAISLQGLESPSQATVYNILVFETPTLPSGPHNITVTFQSDDASTPLTLSYLLIQNGSSTAIASIPTSTPSAISVATSKNGPNVGGIVGGVLGALIFLLSIVAAFIFYRQWRRQREADPKFKNTIPIPFCARPNISREDDATISQSSLGHLNQATTASETPPPVEIVQQTHRRRNSRANAGQAGPSSRSHHHSHHERVEELDEQATYYGGYQTWAQTKALEARSHATRPRDSYM